MKIKVIIEEHISDEFIIEADSIEEAMQIAEEKYYDGDFVVDTFGIPTCKLMCADDGERLTDWVEF